MYFYSDGANQLRVLLQNQTSESITGTSTRTPTTVANAAPEFRPKILIATATANSKKFDVAIKDPGATMSCGNLINLALKYVKEKIP